MNPTSMLKLIFNPILKITINNTLKSSPKTESSRTSTTHVGQGRDFF